MYSLGAWVVRIFLSLTVKRTHINTDTLPKTGAYVLAGRHVSWLDVLCYGIAILPRKIHYMAKEELFSNKSAAWLLTRLNAFPVNRDNPGPSSLKIPSKLLKEGEVFGIFPSGTRDQNAEMKLGVTTIARRNKAPIIPAVYIGPERFSWRFLFKRPQAVVIFGDAIDTAKEVADGNMDEKEIRVRLLQKIDHAFEDLLIKAKNEMKNKSS